VNALVVGYGSIGRRHARLLNEMGCRVAVVSRQPSISMPCFSTLKEAMDEWLPGYVVVANPTNDHEQTVRNLIQFKFRGRLLVEKPVFEKSTEFLPHDFSHAAVAYNLRCHPLIMRLKERLTPPAGITTVTIYAGSYLPDWRPGTDYRESYSAKREKGGGVLRDLSHELDYTSLLFGPWQRLTAMGGQLGTLDIDSDDGYSLIMETQHCPLVTIHMNYLDRTPCRQIRITTDQESIQADLIKNTLTINDQTTSFEVARDDTYRSQHMRMLKGEVQGLCSIKEAMETLITIEAAEKSASSNTWVRR